MGKTKQTTKQKAQAAKKQVKTDPVEAKNADFSKIKDPKVKPLSEIDHTESPGTVPDKKTAARDEVMVDKLSVVRRKRKLSETQVPESDLSKTRRISSEAQRPSAKKSHSDKSSQTTKRARNQLRSRIKKDSQHPQPTSTSSEGLEAKEQDIKARRKPRKKTKIGDPGQMLSAAVDSNASVKKEPEEESAINGSYEAKKLVGAHCSIAGGLHKAVEEAVAMGGRAIGLFLRSQRTWNSKPLEPEAANKFKAACKEHGFPPNSILPHGSYLMNCGSPNPETLKKSRESLLEELQRCEALGLTLYNFHPGSTCGEISVEKCLDSIADAINWAHQQTKFVITVVENMSCQGNTVGGRFDELRGIIDRVKDKSRIGICLDTCHAFAAGFDLSSKEGFDKFVSDFDRIVGFQYLKAMHLNDSKGAVGCHLDRHENIGKGKIGIEGFRRVMTEPRFNGIPMILETPLGDYAKEIRTLNKLM